MSLPPISAFENPYAAGSEWEERFVRLAQEADPQDILGLLREGPDKDPQRLLTAMRVAPHLAQRLPTTLPIIAESLRILFSSPLKLKFEVGYPREVVVGFCAFSSCCETLKSLSDSNPPMASALAAIFEAALRAGHHVPSLAYAARQGPVRDKPLMLEPMARRVIELLCDKSLDAERRWQCWQTARELNSVCGRAWDTAVSAAIDILGEPGEDEALRELLLPAVMESWPQRLEEAIARGLLPKRTVPPIERLYRYAGTGDRGEPEGPEPWPPLTRAQARLCEAQEVVSLLETPQDLGRALGALTLLADIPGLEASLARRAGEALLALLEDARAHRGRISGGRSDEEFRPAPLALSALKMLSQKRPVDEASELMAGALARILSAPRLLAMLPQCLGPAAELPRLWPLLAAAAGDARRPAEARIAAFDALWKAAPGKSAMARPGLQESFTQAKDSLLALLSDPRADWAVRDYVLTNLAALDPEAVGRLQAGGVILAAGLPRPEDVLVGASSWMNEERLAKAAAETTPELALAALQGDEAGPGLSAIYLAVPLARRSDWRPLAQGLLRWVGSEKSYNLISKTGSERINLGDAAANKLRELCGAPSRAKDPEALAALRQAFAVMLDERPETPGVRPGLSLIGAFLRAAAPEELRAALAERLRERKRPATLRWRAFYEISCHLKWKDSLPSPDWKTYVDYALDSLRDPREDPGFRAILGHKIRYWGEEAIAAYLDQSQEPWTLKPGAPADLPICEPDSLVPEEWLASAVRLSRDEETRRAAVCALKLRFLIEDSSDRDRVQRAFLALALCQPGDFPAALRAAADGKPLLGLPSQAAKDLTPLQRERKTVEASAALLALLGNPADEERIARCALEGGWVPFPATSPKWTLTNLMMNEYDSENAAGEVWSTFDSYILAGYGPRAQALRAKLLAHLARRHSNALRHQRASATFAEAQRLDPSLRAADWITD